MDPIQALLLQADKQTTSFPANSRYYQLDTLVMAGANGDPISYLKRRFVPRPESFTALQEHRVREGERLDNITHRYLGDPELYWRICDANYPLHPLDLTSTPNQSIRITLPYGLSGKSL